MSDPSIRGKISFDKIFVLTFYSSIAAFIFALMYALFEDAHSRGLSSYFSAPFYGVGFVVFVFIIRILAKRDF